MTENKILKQADDFIFTLFKNAENRSLIFHDYKHTADVVKASEEIGKESGLDSDQLELVMLAAWFHDVGYLDVCKGHELISAKTAEEFLIQQNYNPEKIKTVKESILATQLDVHPKNILEEVICDADVLNVGTNDYLMRSKLLREEMEQITGELVDEKEWLEGELNFLNSHKFFTRYVQLKYSETKAKNIVIRREELKKIIKKEEESALKLRQKEIDKSEKRIQNIVPQRGVETMFRTALRNHISLSAIADDKANLMLSINAIIISITISVLIPNYQSHPELIIPASFMLTVSLVTIIFATLSTMPKVTSGVFTKEDILQKRTNLLFFGNFYKNTLEEFQWGMGEMMRDRDFLYGTMVRDLHSLGKVLSRKYSYLRLTYQIFMFGMIITLLLFGVFIALASRQ